MDDTVSLDAALRRLTAALQRLEDLASREPTPNGGVALVPDAEDDGLAKALEVSESRAKRLDAANRDVARRVDHAVTTIQSVLDGTGRGEG